MSDLDSVVPEGESVSLRKPASGKEVGFTSSAARGSSAKPNADSEAKVVVETPVEQSDLLMELGGDFDVIGEQDSWHRQ